MSRLFSARELAERALRKIGAFSINDTAADPEELHETLFWMDMAIAEFVGAERCHWLIPVTVEIPLTTSASYDLSAAAGSNYPSNGIIFPTDAYLRDSSGNDVEIDLWGRRRYESIDDKDATGEPAGVYIDRLTDDQNLFVHPVPASAGLYTLRLVCQTYAETVATQTGAAKSGNVQHGWPVEWQRWLINQTAADTGSGPVRRLPKSDVDDIRRDAELSRNRLTTYSNREKRGVRRTQAWGA